MGVAHGYLLASSAASAQSGQRPADDTLAAARALFADALQDEEAGRPADALEKFERVRRVRDTASIEYRIGTCLEALGQLPAAYAAYRSAARLGRTGDAETLEVAGAASARADALSKHLARLTLVLPEAVPPGLQVRLDGEVLAPPALGSPLWLAPGHHTVAVAAPGATPVQSEIALGEGAEVSLALSPAAPPPPPALASSAAPSADTAPSGPTWNTAGVVLAGGGATLLAASTVLLILRAADISQLDDRCPQGHCPPGSDRSDLLSIHQRALVEGPVALGCGIAGVAAAALGLYLVVGRTGSTPATSPTAEITPLVGFGAAGISLAGALP
jgi:tetratricopeptide (TPR) repeat protein